MEYLQFIITHWKWFGLGVIVLTFIITTYYIKTPKRNQIVTLEVIGEGLLILLEMLAEIGGIL
jgi:hypothetical protein